MVIPAREAVIRRTGQFGPLLDTTARQFRLDPWLVAAVCCQESAGDPFSDRYEPGFLSRYWEGIKRVVRATVLRRDDYWLARQPHVFATSYGLMQVLGQVAIERGFLAEMRYPGYLYKPELNVLVGCSHLAHLYKTRAGVDLQRATPTADQTRRALLAYNGGGEPTYPDKVLHWRDDFIAVNPCQWPVPA